VDAEVVQRARDDIGFFAKAVCGAELWPHQLEVALSTARYRCVAAGRQSGKSRGLAVIASHAAFAKPGVLVLIVSAGEVASARLLAECSSLTSSSLLKGSVVDELKGSITLSNGSRVLSVPASAKQIRGWAADLLIVDESGFVPHELWQSAEPTIIARPGSRVILTSSPWGSSEHFFRALWQRGMDRPDGQVRSWHWPSTISPLVDATLLEQIRQREPADYFRREYLAEWTDATGAFFGEAEITNAVADYELVSPEQVRGRNPYNHETKDHDRPFTAVAGVDWAYSVDAQAVVLVSAMDDGGLNDGDDLVYYVPWFEAAYRCPYARWVDRLAEVASSYRLMTIGSECNGCGAPPTETLRSRLYRDGTQTRVAAVWTDNRRKMSGFSRLKMMLQGVPGSGAGRLVLPRAPELLSQLRSLEFEQLTGGGLRIEVPERAGHDDLAMAFMQAISCVRPGRRVEGEIEARPLLPHTVTGTGIKVPLKPQPVQWHRNSYRLPSGAERSTDAAW
jgi:hypothetical protein